MTEPAEAALRIWLAHLPTACGDVAQARASLSSAEREQASRFRFARDSARFVRTRALLRQLLAGHLRCAATDVALETGTHGRPVLVSGAGGTTPQFSVSHAGDWAVIGIARGRRIGVDLEMVRAIPEFPSVAKSNFTEREARVLAAAAPDERLALFYTIWTRKEACLKAIGLGIPGGLDRFEVIPVDARNETSGHPFAVSSRVGDADSLWVVTISPNPQCVASIAFDGLPEIPQLLLLGTAEGTLAPSS